MYDNRHEFSISRMAKVLEVSVSGYYKWVSRITAELTEKELEDIALAKEISSIFNCSKGSLGSRKITRRLNENRIKPVNHKRVERIMSDYCLHSKVFHKFKCTTDSKHSELIADNLLDRDFTADRPNTKMVSDTTVISTKQGDLYIAGIIDLFGRMPVGFAMSRHNDKQLVIDALEDMIARGCGSEGCIMHSDRGSTYASRAYRIRLSEYGLLCSMSKKGDCWDNAPMESFWGKMKEEWLKPNYNTLEEAKRDVMEYVWYYYPYERPHEALDYEYPADVYRQA
ncbi:MAG: IS3 family transposase [Bacteroidaceae bacterium]|nr:IS3 family transposase [Bacteroidaceae bacterium]